MADRFYIAYGSNLSREQMAFRTPDAEIVGTAVLKGWRLLFRQYATIKKNSKFETPVLVWKISEQDEKNLEVLIMNELKSCSGGLTGLMIFLRRE